MPMHDWTRVDDGTFHDFHTAWIGELRKVLNRGGLPKGYYALAEQQAGEVGPDRSTPTSAGRRRAIPKLKQLSLVELPLQSSHRRWT